MVDDFLTFGKNIVTAIANGIKSAPGIVLKAIKSLLPGGKLGKKMLGVLGMGGAAEGGVIRSGAAWVGERGPELLSMKNGAARIYPLPSPTVAPIAAGAGFGAGDVHVPVYLDGRVITEVVAQRTSDRKARR